MSEPTYTPLHPVVGESEEVVEDNSPRQHAETLDGDDYTYEEDDADDHETHHQKHLFKKEVLESFDFNDVESMMWRKVILSISCYFFVSPLIHLHYFLSINFEDITKEKGNSGLRQG